MLLLLLLVSADKLIQIHDNVSHVQPRIHCQHPSAEVHLFSLCEHAEPWGCLGTAASSLCECRSSPSSEQRRLSLMLYLLQALPEAAHAYPHSLHWQPLWNRQACKDENNFTNVYIIRLQVFEQCCISGSWVSNWLCVTSSP